MLNNLTFYSWLAAYEWAKSNNVDIRSISPTNNAPLRWTLTYKTKEV